MTTTTDRAYIPPYVNGHGSAARYRRHRRAGEAACTACKEAHATAERTRRAIRRAIARRAL